MNTKNQDPYSPKESKLLILGTIGSVIVIILAAIIVLPPFFNQRDSFSEHTYCFSSRSLLTNGFECNITAGSYISYCFSIPAKAYSIVLKGSYVSNNTIEVGILTCAQLAGFAINHAVMYDAKWYSGNNKGATIYFNPSPGTSYSLVIYNLNTSARVTFLVKNSIVLSYSNIT